MRRRDVAKALMVSTGPALLAREANAQSCTPPCYSQTAAEQAAGVTPVNYAYAPGHLKRYGAALDAATDDTAALVAALAQAQKSGGAAVYLPQSAGCKIASAASLAAITSTVTIYGDSQNGSYFFLSNDITLFTFSGANVAGSILRNIQIVGKGAGATQSLVIFSNAAYNRIEGCYIRNGGYGVRYLPGGNSCFLNSIRDSRIVSNNIANIDAQENTNNLTLYNVTFGGGPVATGLHIVDSVCLGVFGFDVEGTSLCAIDIDATGAQTSWGHVILGGDIEGDTSTAGSIRLGATNTFPVVGVQIGSISSSTVSASSFLNAINCLGVEVTNVVFNSGFTGPGLIDGWLAKGAHAFNITTRNAGNYNEVLANASAAAQKIYGDTCFTHNPPQGTAAPALANSGIINTQFQLTQRVAPTVNVTGIILQPGSQFSGGKIIRVINESAFTVTFAAAGISNVADGVFCVIPALQYKDFIWNAQTSLWYHS